MLAFAAYAVGTGSLNVAFVVNPVPTRPELMWVAFVFALLGYWGFFVYFPRRLSRAQLLPAVGAAAAGMAMGLGFAIGTSGSVPGTSGLLVATDLTLRTLVSGGIIAVALILPIRAGWMDASGAEARSLGILAVGIVAATAGTFPDIGRIARGDGPAMVGILDAVYVLLPTLLWLAVTRRPHARVARTVIIASVTIYIASLGLGPAAAWALGQAGAALLLGYAVLRGQIDGLDLKVRFALSRSTIAAAFIAVFFIASEGAQIVFGAENEWVGLFAAGALVFAIAPLQRAAERLAEKAVPSSSVPGDTAVVPDHEEAYRRAVRIAVRDRTLSADEEVHLAELADALGIGAGRAAAVLRDVKRESEVVP